MLSDEQLRAVPDRLIAHHMEKTSAWQEGGDGGGFILACFMTERGDKAKGIKLLAAAEGRAVEQMVDHIKRRCLECGEMFVCKKDCGLSFGDEFAHDPRQSEVK